MNGERERRNRQRERMRELKGESVTESQSMRECEKVKDRVGRVIVREGDRV